MSSPSPHFPHILFKSIQGFKAEIHLEIPKNLAYFDGHFNNMPVVPGVVQLHWVVKFVREFFDIPAHLTKGTQIKFMNLMQPNHKPILQLEIAPEKSFITYIYASSDANEGLYSSGKLTYDA
jgi:3-hydroxymyristoyl/3-hydroxydecanoyl-(acyl carrier protein) dehydratase